MSSGKVDFFIVGAMRSGTSSIRDALIKSPYLNVANGEPRFFHRNDLYEQGYDSYHQLFDWSKRYRARGEKSPQYAVSPFAAKRIREYNPSARIVWMLRDPVKRAISHAAHSRFRTQEAIPLDVAVRDREKLESTRSTMAYVFRSQYEKHLVHWLESFPRQQHHVMILEEVLKNPWRALLSLHEFLDVPLHEDVEFPHVYKPEVRKIAEDNPVSDSAMQELQAALNPTVDWVEGFLGRRIPSWR